MMPTATHPIMEYLDPDDRDVLMGGPSLAADCTICSRPRRATRVLLDTETDTTLPLCDEHYTARRKLRGFVEPDAPPPSPPDYPDDSLFT